METITSSQRSSQASSRRKARVSLLYTDDHKLTSDGRGQSEVEALAKRIEERRAARIVITFDVRVALLRTCRKVAIQKGYPISKIDIFDLKVIRENVTKTHEEAQKTLGYKVKKLFRFRCHSEQMLNVLNKAVEVVEYDQDDSDNWFYYMDFNQYYTKVESQYPWMRSGASVAFMWLLIYYFFTPIFFCHIVHDEGVCLKSDGMPYSGWMSALYFASTTLSTVGYGDLGVTLDETHKVFFGICFMIFSNIILIGSFSAVADSGSTPLTKFQEKIITRAIGKPTADELLYRKIRRLKILRISELVFAFMFLNLIGVLASQLFLLAESDEIRSEWNWMTSVYWAVQTTTTIGYGDLNQPFHMRWFQIFYLILSTYFVGQTLGSLASLRDELEEVRIKTAWGRREVSRGLIDEMQPEDNNGSIDQYEFLVASLLQLQKISLTDIEPIMDKFRSLQTDGFIQLEHIIQEEETNNDNNNQAIDALIQDEETSTLQGALSLFGAQLTSQLNLVRHRSDNESADLEEQASETFYAVEDPANGADDKGEGASN